ncbi:Uncharacterised protein [Candidatus Norongarragalina meridionalis]|nr:Uncharacterised protein [Candidatus Norongarragalina meridionalis]
MILGGRITEASAKRLKDGAVKGLNVNIDITSVKEEEGALLVSYTHKTDYQDEVAELVIKGDIIIQEDAKVRKEILEGWKEKKFLASEFAEDVLNAISYSAASVGTLLAFTLGIGAPINLPRAKLNIEKGKAS